MCNFEISNLLFYSHIPILLAALFFAFFIILSDKRSKANQNLFIFVIFFCFWIVNDMMQWLIFDVNLNLFFSRISLLQVLSLPFFIFFVYELLGFKIGMKKKAVMFIPFFPILLLLFSEYNITINSDNCETNIGPLYTYITVLSLALLAFVISLLMRTYRKTKDLRVKNQIKLITLAILILIVWMLLFSFIIEFSINNGYGDGISQFSSIGVLIFIAILTYTITKYKLLNIKIVGAQVLVLSLIGIIGSQYFFVENNTNIILIGITLIMALFFGYILVQSIKKEIERKEELQLMADKLAVANDQLRKLDNAKTEFISIASHQLRTPLTSVKGFVSMIIEGSYGDISPDVKGALVKVYASSERLIQLVEDLLNVSRIEAGRLQFSFEKADIGDVMQEIYDNFMLIAKNKKMYLDLKMPKVKIPQINMDSGKIREVVSNLVDNAFKYTEKGGVTMKAEIIGNETMRVTISDTGIGVPKDEVQHLFKKFSRGKNTARLHASGTGLGLYVGKEIINAHNGKLWLESDGAGKGSRFIIELPIDQPKK